MIIASPNIVLPDSFDNGNNPIFGYRNVVAVDNVVASSEYDAFPATNLANPATDLEWRAQTIGAHTIDVDTEGLGPVDYIGLARHNFATAGIAVKVQEDVGAGYVDITDVVLPGADDVMMFRVNRSARTTIRVCMAEGTVAPRLAVLYVGKLMVSQRRVYVGHTPITMGRDVVDVVGRSEVGDYLGRIILSESLSTQFSIQNITPSFYRENFDPMVKSVSRGNPCFFAWRPMDYREEVGYGWFTRTPRPVNQRSNGMMSVTLDFGAIAQ